MKDIIMQISVEDLVKAILNELKPILSSYALSSKVDDSEEFLTRQEVAGLLKVSLPTVHKYVNWGYLVPHRIPNSSRVYFKKGEVYKLLDAGKKKG